jgi:ArsR family transcriptional regulator
VLERARARAASVEVTNIRFVPGDMEALPLGDASMDLCLLSQILHHAAQPQAALQEAYRVLAPGGRVLVIDLMPHQEEWVRERLGDQWLGFEPDTLRTIMATAGFDELRCERVGRRRGEAFEVLITSGRRP